MSDKPDNIVYNKNTEKYDANTKNYPTAVGGQKFDVVKLDKSDVVKANKYFNKRSEELKKDWENLVNEYKATKLIYETECNFQPILGEVYHIYESKNGDTFLSLINPNEWNKKYFGSYILNTNGTWEKIDYGVT